MILNHPGALRARKIALHAYATPPQRGIGEMYPPQRGIGDMFPPWRVAVL